MYDEWIAGVTGEERELAVTAKAVQKKRKREVEWFEEEKRKTDFEFFALGDVILDTSDYFSGGK